MKIRTVCWLGLGLAALAVVGWPGIRAHLIRQLEERLNRETGREWRIGGLGLGAGPTLVLTDVATGNPGSGMSVARMAVSAPLSLIAGGTGPVQLRGERIALGVLVDRGPPEAPMSASDMLRGLDARVRGLVVGLSSDGRRLTASMDTADIDLDLAPDATASAVAITHEDTGQRLRIVLDRAGTGTGRSVRLDVTPGPTQTNMPTVRMAATLRTEAALVQADAISGTLNGSPITGSARLALAARPALTADLRLGEVVLRARDDAAANGKGGLDVPVPTAALPAPSWFAPFDAELRLAASRLTIGPARFETVTATATVRGGTLEAVVSAARAYEGEIKLRYALLPAGESGIAPGGRVIDAAETGRHRLSVTLARARLAPLLSDVAGARGLDAWATARIDVQATAARPADLPRMAAGFADVTLTDGRIEGADFLGRGGDGPFTRFHTLGAGFSIADGRATTNDLQLRSPLIQATGAGALDLVARTLDFRFQPSVTPQRGRPTGGATLNVPVRVSGPWESPAVSADMAGLLQNPAGAIEALQDLGTGLFGTETGGRNGADGRGFDGLLDTILPRGERAAPQPRRR